MEDNPEWDATDFAHPAWWRGNDHAIIVMCDFINKIIDGTRDVGGTAREPWESTRKRLFTIVSKANAYDMKALYNAQKG